MFVREDEFVIILIGLGSVYFTRKFSIKIDYWLFKRKDFRPFFVCPGN